jgi:hypothetical protein
MVSSPSLLHQLYSGTLQNRLNFGKALHAQLSHRLMQDPTFACTFATLRQAADTLAGYMAARGMGRQCTACATNNPGGCCSREIAEETDALQMLMNLLAGVKVDISEGQGETCCFIGTEGCSFMFKPMFCLNYNCTRIIAQMGPARSELELLTGRLLGIQYEVEKMLLARLK